ncbi:MAG: DUF1735 domain-containing protein [Prolixibacteraceae bacterium]|nr:DUF1735 domain-containing protein [Prolixibacteraceae bacterium]
MKKGFIIAGLALTLFTACHNQPWDFPDHDYTTVYFPYQYPIRTLVLGEDIIDNTLDNEHKFKVMATLGGVYENKENVTIDVVVDNSLCDQLIYGAEDSTAVLALPESYYTLPDNKQIVISAGEFTGGIEVQLTDAFFNDPLAVERTYVLPLRMTAVNNADSILQGKSDLADPDRRVTADWATVPKDYTLYAVKYINQWHGNYLRRGVTEVKGSNGNTDLDTTMVYHEKYVEWDQVVSLKTKSLSEVALNLNSRVRGTGEDLPFELRISFNSDGKCTLTQPANAAYSVTGNGEFVKDGDAWGNEPRDVLHLKYNVTFENSVHSFTDTVVMRDRGIKLETFVPVVL